jgi:hypothetical protein
MPVYLFPGTACLNHDFTDLPDYRETLTAAVRNGEHQTGNKKVSTA